MSTPQWYPLVETPAYVMLATLILLPTVVTVPVYVQMIGISTLIIFLGKKEPLLFCSELKKRMGFEIYPAPPLHVFVTR